VKPLPNEKTRSTTHFSGELIRIPLEYFSKKFGGWKFHWNSVERTTPIFDRIGFPVIGFCFGVFFPVEAQTLKPEDIGGEVVFFKSWHPR